MSELETRPEDNSPGVSSAVNENEVPETEPAQTGPIEIPQSIIEEPAPPAPAKKSRKGLIAGLVIAAAAVAAGGYIYTDTAKEYETKYLPNTIINGINVGDLAPADIEERLRLSSENYSITVKLRNGTEKIDGNDFGYHYVSSGEAERILEEQEPLMWGLSFLGQQSSFTVTSSTAYDEALLAGVVRGLPELQPENETPPENAFLNFGEDGTFSIVPETAGTMAIPDAVAEAVLAAAGKRIPTIDLSNEEGMYESPVVFADNPDLVYQCENLNDFLATSVTYLLPDNRTKTLDREILRGWITRQDNGFYYVDEELLTENVRKYVQETAAETNRTFDTRPFNTTVHGQVQVPCDEYGIIIDEGSETDLLYAELVNHESAEREPVYTQKSVTPDPNFSGSYIEVDVSGQHVYYYRNGALVLDSACVSGTYYDPSHRTPCGVFSIYYLERNRTLHGTRYPDGSFEYSTFVNYWMPFYHGCGLHDAPWRGEFGGSIYLTSGSHGCVNLPLDIAARLYESVYVGMPVIVYYAG